MAVFDPGQVTAQQASLFFDVALGKPLLEAVGADGGADLDHGRLFPLPVESLAR